MTLLNVPGVMRGISPGVPLTPPIWLVAPAVAFWTMARKAAVFGEGGGKDAGPPVRGVIPVPGVRPVRTKLDGSNERAWWMRAEVAGVGRLATLVMGSASTSSSMPDRRDEIAGVLRGQVKASFSARGVVMWPMEGREGLGSPGVVLPPGVPSPLLCRLARVVKSGDGLENESSNGLTSPVSLDLGNDDRRSLGSLEVEREEGLDWAEAASVGGTTGASEEEGAAGATVSSCSSLTFGLLADDEPTERKERQQQEGQGGWAELRASHDDRRDGSTNDQARTGQKRRGLRESVPGEPSSESERDELEGRGRWIGKGAEAYVWERRP